MVESTAFLLRSYSNPSSFSPETKQGDPFRCLTSSKSFGRYMSESLNWEKWSTFTENRYMEDVKKYSRPGFVARMKAYFEAHYKKKAAERAEALLEKPNAACGSIGEEGSMQMENHVVKGEIPEEEVTRNNHPLSGEGRAPECAQFVDAEENKLVENIEDVQGSRCNQNINGIDQVDVCGHFKSIEDNGKRVCEDKKTKKKAIPELGDPASLGKKKTVFSPFKSRGRIGIPKPPAPPKPSVPIRKRQQHRKANSVSRENAADVENRKPTTRSFHISVDLARKETKTPLSPILQRLVNSRLVKTLAGKAAQGKPLRDTDNTPAHPPVSIQHKKLNSKSSSTRTRSIQSPTVPCEFSFKSNERAAKRKEFFERLEQNEKAKETGKDKRQVISKVKARKDFKFANLAAAFKVAPCSDFFHTRRAPSDASKVIAAIPTPSFVSGETPKDNNARPPRRLRLRGKNNQSPAYPLKSVSKKFTSENASPNIQVC